MAKRNTKKKVCSACEKPKLIKDFYMSYNPLHADKCTPMCKECITDAVYDELNDEINMESLKSILRQLDKPFISSMWKAAITYYDRLVAKDPTKDISKKVIIGNYFKNINSLIQVRHLNWEEGFDYDKRFNYGNASDNEPLKPFKEKNDTYSLPDNKFIVTEEMIQLFGEGYKEKEYSIMFRHYENLKEEYPNVTNSQKNLLIRYIRFTAKEELATAIGSTAEAEKWAKLASESLKQLNQSDLQGSVSSFSEFFQKIERAKDIIPILPQYKYRPNDAPDFIIWCFINYCRRLEGKTECTYEDVYHFYDEKKEEYIKQYGDPYGIFKDDPTLENRDKIEEFIIVPPDYEDGD